MSCWKASCNFKNTIKIDLDKKQKKILLRRLAKEYGDPKSELKYKTPFQLLVAVMLSAQSTDKKVNEITPILFSEYPDPLSMSKAMLKDVESIIRQINYHKTKSKHLILASKIIQNEFCGNIPKTYEELMTLPGVGNKTANVVLSELGIKPTFPVDTHVFRVSKRLGLASSDNRDRVEKELCEEFPESSWRELHHWLIFHGRRVCKARNPQCESCVLKSLCPY